MLAAPPLLARAAALEDSLSLRGPQALSYALSLAWQLRHHADVLEKEPVLTLMRRGFRWAAHQL